MSDAMMAHCAKCGTTTTHTRASDGSYQCRRCVLEESVPSSMAYSAPAPTEPPSVEAVAKRPSKIPQTVVGVLLLAALGWLVYKAAVP